MNTNYYFCNYNENNYELERTYNNYGYYKYKLYINGEPVDMRKAKHKVQDFSREKFFYKYDNIFFGTDNSGCTIILKENIKETEILRRQLKNPTNWWLMKTSLEDSYYLDKIEN